MSWDLTQNDIDLLSKDPLFRGLAPKHLKVVIRAAKVVQFEQGAELIVSGEKAGRFYLITEGEAAISVNGVERSVVGPGASFGEVSLVDNGPRMATIVARTPVRAVSLASFTFRPLLREHPEIFEAVALRLCALLRSERTYV